jgi:O-antigen ligase
MPPAIATFLTVGFILFLFLRDPERKDGASGAMWLPTMWMAITGSRFLSQWMQLGDSASAADEGSLLDVAYFLTLILAGICVLIGRRVNVGELFRDNQWLFLFLLYCFFAILWSDYPFTSFKRWVKALGNPIMALVILTDRNPVVAFRIVMKRCSYLLIPLSVLFIKYLPEYGRGFDFFTGKPTNHGVGLTKNDLGYVCMLFGLFFYWNLLAARQIQDRRRRHREILLSVGMLLLIGWCLDSADSATSLISFLIGAATLTALGLRVVNKRAIGTYLIVCILAVWALNSIFDISDRILLALDRSPTLTDRTHLWGDVLALQDSPIIGAGYEGFWTGERLRALWAAWWWHPNQAHNGYIETYLNLGAVGIALLCGVIVSTYRKIAKKLSTDFPFARLRLALLFAILAFNYTEAAFKGVHLVWTLFYIIAIDCAVRERRIEEDARAPHAPTVTTQHSIVDVAGKA